MSLSHCLLVEMVSLGGCYWYTYVHTQVFPSFSFEKHAKIYTCPSCLLSFSLSFVWAKQSIVLPCILLSLSFFQNKTCINKHMHSAPRASLSPPLFFRMHHLHTQSSSSILFFIYNFLICRSFSFPPVFLLLLKTSTTHPPNKISPSLLLVLLFSPPPHSDSTPTPYSPPSPPPPPSLPRPRPRPPPTPPPPRPLPSATSPQSLQSLPPPPAKSWFEK